MGKNLGKCHNRIFGILITLRANHTNGTYGGWGLCEPKTVKVRESNFRMLMLRSPVVLDFLFWSKEEMIWEVRGKGQTCGRILKSQPCREQKNNRIYRSKRTGI